jgi:DNA-binding MarR family transcriptional regulator
MYMSGDNKPIGWWIKEVDRLLEGSFEQVLAADGVSRRQWQALNAAHNGERIERALSPFLASDPAELAAVIESLTTRGWLANGDQLTPAGATALAALGEKVQAERRRITNGIVDSEYLQTIDVLRRMALNLGHQPESA